MNEKTTNAAKPGLFKRIAAAIVAGAKKAYGYVCQAARWVWQKVLRGPQAIKAWKEWRVRRADRAAAVKPAVGPRLAQQPAPARG